MMVSSDLLSPIEVSICFSRLILPSLPSLVCNHLYSTTNLLFPNWPEVVNLYPVPNILLTDMITNGNFFLRSLNILLSKVIDFFVQSGGRSTNMQLVRSHAFLWDDAIKHIYWHLSMDNASGQFISGDFWGLGNCVSLHYETV